MKLQDSIIVGGKEISKEEFLTTLIQILNTCGYRVEVTCLCCKIPHTSVEKIMKIIRSTSMGEFFEKGYAGINLESVDDCFAGSWGVWIHAFFRKFINDSRWGLVLRIEDYDRVSFYFKEDIDQSKKDFEKHWGIPAEKASLGPNLTPIYEFVE